MSRLIEGRAGELVTASAYLALNVRLARLIACRGQTQMRSDIPRSAKAVRLIDRGTKGERGDGSHTWNTHESPADLVLAGDIEDLLCQSPELAQHRGHDRQKRLDKRDDDRVCANPFAHAIGEGCTAWSTEFDAGLPICAKARASLRSVLFGIVFIAALACLVSMQIAGNPSARIPS